MQPITLRRLLTDSLDYRKREKKMNRNKKHVFIAGEVLLPLIINHSAIIYHGSNWTRTSPVVAVQKITQEQVLFETEHSIYYVSTAPISEMAAAPIHAELACA